MNSRETALLLTRYFSDRGYMVMNLMGAHVSYREFEEANAPSLGFMLRGGRLVFITLASSPNKHIAERPNQKASFGISEKMEKLGFEHHQIYAKTFGGKKDLIEDILVARRSMSNIGELHYDHRAQEVRL